MINNHCFYSKTVPPSSNHKIPATSAAICLLWLACLAGPSSAQTNFEFSGYVIDLPVFQSSNPTLAELLAFERNQQFNLTRLRLRPTLNLGSSSRISMEYEISGLYQSDQAMLQSEFVSPGRQLVEMNWTLVEEQHVIVRHFVDRLYFRKEFDFGNIAIGRQREAWGSGRIWNPTDLFNPINPVNFAKIEKDGADMISTQVYFGNFTDLTLVYNAEKEGSENNAGFRFRSNYHTYDISIMSGLFDDRLILGGDFAGNLLDAGFRGEGILSGNKDDFGNNYVRFILGLDYQFTSRLYVLTEFLYNGEGATDPVDYDLFALLEGRILAVAKHYLFLSSSYLLHPLLNSTYSTNLNLDDGSGFFSAFANYSAGNNTYLGLGFQLFWGDEFDEFWYFPRSVYLKGEFYF